MKSVVAVIGPRDAGPGERQEMLGRAMAVLAQHEVDEPVRVDVPGRGAAEVDEASGLREGVDGLVPALQSGSLFGDKTGLVVVDAQNLQKHEAEVAADLVAGLDPAAAVVVFVSTGALPAVLSKAVKASGETISVKKMRERDASEWLVQAARDRGVRIHGDAAATLVRHFGSDVAALGQALDQLASSGEEITPEAVEGRFSNRPDEPMWLYADAVAEGDVAGALRRLADFLTHSHPLVLLSFLSGELRRRALAAAAPDIDAYAEWVGAKNPDTYPVKKAWRRRSHSTDQELQMALRAIARADLTLKTAPEATHRVTMERLTVAMCRWMAGR